MAADAFHAARQKGSVADWTIYLAAVPEPLRREALAELVIIDLEYRWRDGENPCIEDYLHRFPLLGPLEAVPDQLIIEEYRCRREAGQAITLQEIARRFPLQFPRVRPALERLLAQTRPPPPTPLSATDEKGSDIATESETAIAAQYEMLRLLGRGAFGEVWLARKKTSGIEKAIKILPYTTEHSGSRRERRALELIKNLRHPYLLATEDFWISEQRLYIVMELAEGTLRKRLQACREEEQPGMPVDELLRYFREAAEGLDFLHSHAIVHRDIKPDNILLLHGHAKVGDFGLAWHQDRTVASMHTFAGTPVYMAPEVWSQEGGPPSDQYALAITYVEMRQGHPPLPPLPLQELMAAHLEGNYQFDALISPAEQAVLRRALARDPHQRFPTCTAFVSALAAAISNAGTVAPSLTPRSTVSSDPAAGQNLSRTGEESAALPRSSTLHPGASPASASTLQSPATADVTPSAEALTQISQLGTSSPAPKSRRKKLWLTLLGLVMLFLGVTAAIASRWTFPSWLSFSQTEAVTSNSDGQSKNSNNTITRSTSPPQDADASSLALTLPHARAKATAETAIITLADGRRLAERIVIPVGEERAYFRLIAPAGGPGIPAPFYMLETKVWNKLYAASGGTVPPASQVHGEHAPVTGVTALEAARFAQNVFGGRLPTPQEWDYAAGLYLALERDSVSRPGSQVWVAQSHPRSTLAATGNSDVNELGLRDMAGNGREWTCMLLPSDSQAAPQAWDLEHPPADQDAIILRGRNFTLPNPLTFDHLRFEQSLPQRQYAGSRSPYTSFRVVIPLPAP
jgi:serine/threonine protein kinase